MNKEKSNLYYGALLHDIGRIVSRSSYSKDVYPKSGVEFLRECRKDRWLPDSVLEQVRYHDVSDLKRIGLPNDSLAYITCFASIVSSRTNRETGQRIETIDINAKLRRIFNTIDGRSDDNTIEHDEYDIILDRLKADIEQLSFKEDDIDALLRILEEQCSNIPSSVYRKEDLDISLFDRSKTTAAVAACVFDYLWSTGVSDYRETLGGEASSKEYLDKPMFLLWSCDLSGIQDFIYQISGAGALKQLRARSFYLELLLEHCVDTLLERLELTRANLLYTGGGHAYVLLPNTRYSRRIADGFSSKLNKWLMGHFKTDLFCACAFVECSARTLMNEHKGDSRAYRSLFSDLGRRLSEIKSNRYSAEQIKELNYGDWQFGGARECSECHRSDTEIGKTGGSENLCPFCVALRDVSAQLIHNDFFVVGKSGELELPFDAWLSICERSKFIAKRSEPLRVYSKNLVRGEHRLTRIWIGDYTADQNGEGISNFAKSGITLEPDHGIERLGVLRADVDNLGTVFASGIPEELLSISRTATLSRSLSFFFKKRINEVLESGKYRVQIIYSGGDDLFLIGNWSDVIHAALDIRKALDEFTGNGSLTISAGIGLYNSHYPISRMAAEAGALEDAAKLHDGKDAVSLWSTENVFSWREFEGEIIPKFKSIQCAFQDNKKGIAFIYKLIDLLRDSDNPISIPRVAYLLARSFEDASDGGYASVQLYEWAIDERQRRQFILALEWYIYSTRERR